jgi:RNA polymerase sigma-54 factor
MVGLGFALHQTQRMDQRQILTPQQRYLVDMLELPEASLEGYLDELIRGNSAIQRVGDTRFGRDVARAFVRRADDDDLPPPEARAASTPDLLEHLLDQLRLERTTEAELRAAVVICGNLDHHGLLELPLQDVSWEARCSVQEAEDAQWIVMQLDPPGCGASSPQQYLRAMVETQWPDDPFFPDLVEKHLDDLKRRRFDRIAKALDLDPEDVAEYHRMLTEEVDPWPARGWAEADTDYVRPSMEVVRDAVTGRWAVRMLDAARAPVRVDPGFEARINAMPKGPERDEALRKWQHATWIVKSLEERHSLVKQVADVAVAEQRDFFEHGDTYLRNLTMERVAERVGRDTSTVSRAVSGRWYQWEGRLLKLRDLFANRGATQDTSEAALHRAIRDLVDAEDAASPISDDAIARELKKRGMTGVARRTVAKHRERIGIPSSRDRKRR